MILFFLLLSFGDKQYKWQGSRVKKQKENPAGCAGEGKQSKEIRRRGKDGLKINQQQPFVRKKVSRDVGKCSSARYTDK